MVGLSRQFAFAQFVGIPEARTFLERYYPTISIPDAYNSSQNTAAGPAKVRLAYSREKDDRDKPGKGEDDWKCEVVGMQLIIESTLTIPVQHCKLLSSNAMFSMQCPKNP